MKIIHCLLVALELTYCTEAMLTKVLPLGDSITYGCGDQCAVNCMHKPYPIPCQPCSQGYRGPLWKKLTGKNQPTSPDWDFVGNVRSGPDDIDQDHEGHPGWTNEEILGIAKSWVPLQPDIILLHLGTNNLGSWLHVDHPQSAQEALGHMDNLLNATFQSLPHVRLLLSTLIGAGYDYGGQKHAAYNAGIKDFVKTYAALGFKVELVDMEAESGIGQHCDGKNCCPLRIHPNDNGYELMADVWYKHIMANTSNTIDRKLAATFDQDALLI